LRRTLILTTVLLAAGAAPGAALAQQQPTNGAGLRYLSWPGKAAVARAEPAVAAAETPLPTRVSAPVPLARIAPPTPAQNPATMSRGLTPASAWLGAAPRPAASAPEPAAPEPVAVECAAASTPIPASVPAPAPAPGPQPLQAASQPTPEPAPAQNAAADPMAPRRDAPIFRLQRPDGTTAAPPQAGAAASGQNARYYSVHRQAGHEPDAIRTPAPVYLAALPVQMAQTPSSTDLAQPDAPPTLLRSADGKVRALPQTEADELP